MNNPVLSEEFIGRFGVSYKDGEMIYAYDEITHGLYKFDLDLREVNMIISPKDIHWNTGNRVIGISKRRNEIILIPAFSDAEWIFYDVEEQRIQYKPIVENRVRLSSVIAVGDDLFLIPSGVFDPILVVSVDSMKIIQIYGDWHGDRTDENTCIWGASYHSGFVAFPVVNSKKIVRMNRDGINMIIPNIPDVILSVSIYEDKIWILPISGKYIYSTDFGGEIVDRIEISQAGIDILAGKFSRILAVEDAVFLFPAHGANIYVYQFQTKKIASIKTGSVPLRGGLFLQTNTSYWDFVIEKETLHLLPCEYRYKRIHISSLNCEEYSLYFRDYMESEKYWEMVRRVQKGCFAENKRSDLSDFLQYVYSRYENHFAEKKRKIGRKMWGDIKSYSRL